MQVINVEFDENTNAYLSPTPDREVDQTILGMICDYIVPRLTGRRILELGVGDQVWTPRLVERFPDVTTVDASPTLLAAMKETLAGKTWTPVECFFEDYEPADRFDTVLATFVLEHVDDAELILRLAHRKWLREGGRLVVAVPHALSLHRRLAVHMGIASHPGQLGDSDRRMHHKRCVTCHEMERMIVNAGFRVLEKRGMFTKVLPNSMLARCSEEQLRGMFDLGLELPIEYSAAIYFQAQADGS